MNDCNWRSVQQLQSSPPRYLYHYTDTTGLVGIVSGQQLWMSNAEFLNDSAEIRYGAGVLELAIRAEINNLPESTSNFDILRSAYVRALSDLESLSHGAGGFIGLQCNIACFCEEPDLLSQWRGYSVGGGYCIQFDTAKLRVLDNRDAGGYEATAHFWQGKPYGEHNGIDARNLRLTQVAYGDGGTSDELSRQIVTNVSTYVAGQDWSRQGEFPHDVFISRDFILPWVANFKHESFREEREWRMVVVDPPAVSNFRAGPNGVTPFSRLDIPTGAITGVVIGPSTNPDLTERGLSTMLWSNGLHAASVSHSQSPYR